MIDIYYEGIMKRLDSDVSFINSIIDHQGEKGRGNEEAICSILKKYLPKRYSIDTGIIIDKEGVQSKQIDLIIYDEFLVPGIFTLGPVKLIPVDAVFLTIEVKTSLNASTAKTALENIKSVRKLSLIGKKFVGYDYSPDSEKMDFKVYKPTHPLGVVFAYKSKVNDIDAIKQWFEVDNNDLYEFPSMICCLDSLLMLYSEISMSDNGEWEKVIYPVVDELGYAQKFPSSNEVTLNGKVCYPKLTKHGYIAVDPAKTLLNFLVRLNELLSIKKIRESIDFRTNYLKEVNKMRIDA
ncbi:hypothetical protein P3T73_03395 [Kiritimatiellota bacterium B12222]|nr:hypothetical protein P3T73_03395 [Kiritimatiellota bacterium B12222]